jgi:hypothetical protein
VAGDPLRPVTPGEVFAPTADQWNRILASARESAQQQANAITRRRAEVPLPPGCVLVKAGADIAAFTAIELQTPVFAITPGDAMKFDFFKYSDSVWFATSFVTGDHRFAITQQPIKNGQIGVARVRGISPALITVSNASYVSFARAQASPTTKLKGGTFGTSKIMTIETGTGDKWGYIDVNSHAYCRVSGELSGGTLTTGGNRAADIKIGTSATGETLEFFDRDQLVGSTPLPSGKRIYGWYHPDLQKAVLSGWKC